MSPSGAAHPLLLETAMPAPATRLPAVLFPLLLPLLGACGGDDDKGGAADSGGATDDGGAADGGGDDTGGADGGGDPEAVCTEPVEVACVDALLLDLSLHDTVSRDGVTNATDGADFVSVVDASAGGYDQATRNPWVYVKFTESGLQKVEIDDESALESMDWDLSLRRFMIRMNGGSSGPSCVGAVTFPETPYAEVSAVPDGLTWLVDDFYTDDCTIINDSSGLPGSPQLALGQWWEYPGCVATTNKAHLIRVADGHVVKVVVETYYAEGQEGCNTSGVPGSDSGIITLRWQWLE